ncbi:MAG TPA: YkgJ family cysteine cluster protein [Puia sp.]
MPQNTVNLRSFRNLVSRNKKRLRSFLFRMERKAPGNLHLITMEASKLAWAKTDCMDCSNCCKTMSPTYSRRDITRISKFLGMTRKTFTDKWLYKDQEGDWINKNQPCQFLDQKTNLCGIYEVRPRDCAGFPYHSTKKIRDYGHMYRQNVEFCPATNRLVEIMQAGIRDGTWSIK